MRWPTFWQRHASPITTESARLNLTPEVADADDPLFRRTAIEHYLATDEQGDIIRISPPWTWILLVVVMVVLGVTLAASVVTSVEITDRGPAILRPAGGIRTLVAETGGVVSEIQARSGQEVPQSQTILVLASAGLQARLLEAERELQLLTTDAKGYAERQSRTYDEQERLLAARLNMLRDEERSQEQSVASFERKLTRTVELEKSGLLSVTVVEDVREAVAQSRRQLSNSKRSVTQTQQELASIRSRRQDELWQREQALKTARSQRDALAFSLRQTRIQAPVAGIVEAVTVKVGDVVQATQIVGKLVPQDRRFQVVAFLPEKDRSSVKLGDEVRLELEQFPYAEFGTIRGHIKRIGDDLASSAEMREALGEDARLSGSAYRVEIAISDPAAIESGGIHLRSGMLMNVRYTLRRERPITFFFAPIRRWLS